MPPIRTGSEPAPRPGTLFAALLAAVIGAAPPAQAAPEAYLWKPVAIGGGGFITGLDTDARGETWVARADVHGAYIWRADQDRWARLTTSATLPEEYRVRNGANEGVYEIVVAPSESRRLYMVLKGRFLRSEDGGRSFEPGGAGLPPLAEVDPNGEFRLYGPFLAVDPENPDLVLLGTPANGLWRSANGGRDWAPVPSVPPARDLRPEIPGTQAPGIVLWFATQGGAPTGAVWAMSPGNGLFLSTDGGAHFTPMRAGEGPSLVAQGAFAPDGSFYAVDPETEGAWVFRRGRWTDLTRTGLPRARFVAVAASPASGQVLVFDEGGAVFRSLGDDAWSRLGRSSAPEPADPPWLRVSDQSYFAMGRARFDPVRPERIWAGAGTGVYYADVPVAVASVDWRSRTRGIEELVATDVAQSPGRAPLFAFLDFGIHRKPDLDAFSTGYGPKERVLIAAQQLALSPADPDFVATNASDTRTSCCSEDGDAVLAGFSHDAGRSWEKFPTLPRPPGTEAGDPWRMAFGTLVVSAGDTANILWEPSFNRAPFFTRDRGAHWRRVVLPGEVPPDTGSHATIYLNRKNLVADGLLPGVFYYLHGGGGANAALAGLWRSADGGAGWTRVQAGEIVPRSQYALKLRAVPGRAGDLFLTAAAGGADTLARRSRDGGAHWEILEGVEEADDFAFGKAAAGREGPTIFLSGRVNGQSGVWRSVDDAASWQRIGGFPVGSLDQVTVMGADPDRFGRVYLGYMGSGFLYGEPASCAPADFAAFAATECAAVE